MQLILRRLVQLVVVLLIVSFFTFCLVRLLPGDPTKTIIPFGTDAQRAQLQGGPRPRQALLRAVLRLRRQRPQGDLGHQYPTNTPVSDLISSRSRSRSS